MQILINCVNLLSGAKGAGGAGRYVLALVTALAKTETIRILVSPSNFGQFQQIPGLQVVPLLANDSISIHDHLNWCDLYFCPLNELVPTCINAAAPVVSCILDLQHEVYPQFFKPEIYAARRKYYGYAISRANGIVTISEHEKSLIQKIYGKQEVYVTPLAGYLAEEVHDDGAKFDLQNSPYIIYPAIPWRHKNHYRLLEALAILNSEYQQNLKLVLTGAREHQLKASTVDKIIDNLGLSAAVEIKGFISDAELAQLIKNAELMAFPSLYEGFGIPLVDAMNLGTPAIASAVAAVPEMCGEAIAYFRNPWDSKAIAADLFALLADKAKLAQLAAAGKIQGSKYSAQKTAAATLAAFHQVVAKYRSGSPISFVSAKFAPANLGQSTKRVTLIIDALSENNLDQLKLRQLAEIVEKIPASTWELIKVIDLTPLNSPGINYANFNLAELDLNHIYADRQQSAYYFNALNYLIDTGINTDYLMYWDLSTATNLDQLDLTSAIATLDVMDNISAVAFTDGVQFPQEISPLTGIELIKQYNFWKPKRLEFFHLKLIRSAMQAEDNHIGTCKFLSTFLSEATYLNYPITRGK